MLRGKGQFMVQPEKEEDDIRTFRLHLFVRFFFFFTFSGWRDEWVIIIVMLIKNQKNNNDNVK